MQELAGAVETILTEEKVNKECLVDWEVDGKILEASTAEKINVSFVYPEKANHVLKHEETPREQLNAPSVSQRYNAPDAELDEQAANAIFNWLKNQIKQ